MILFFIGFLVGAVLMILWARHYNRSAFDNLPEHCYLCGRPAKVVNVTTDIASREWVDEQNRCGPCHDYIVQNKVEPPWKKEGGCPPDWKPES